MSILFASIHAVASCGGSRGTVVNAKERLGNPPPNILRTTELLVTAAEYSGRNGFPDLNRGFSWTPSRDPNDHPILPEDFKPIPSCR
jgi:hypothetical protein